MIAALLLAAAPVDLAPDESKAVEVSIAAVAGDPKKFDGHLIRVHGFVNSCATACAVDERPANSPGGVGASIRLQPDRRFDEIVRPLVPTYVELDGYYSAGCDSGAVCLDGYRRLEVVSVRGVVSPEPPPFQD